jgi:glycerol-3-phosphate acyltransferase PlsX
MRIAIDAMGGDKAPREIVKGAVQAVKESEDSGEIVLVGDENVIREYIPSDPPLGDRLHVVHSSQIVEMNESPVEAVRKKPDCSIMKAASLAADGKVGAIISAGNTGAFVAACHMKLRRLPGLHRPGIAVVIPTYDQPCVICDAGSNISCKPRHLHQYAIMAGIYAEQVLGIENPRVGLLSVGQEDLKGNILVKASNEYIRKDKSINFIGNIEGRDIFQRVADVIVTDGFVGNVVLKLIEGVGEGVLLAIARDLRKENSELAAPVNAFLSKLARRHDYREYGGAPLLGLNGVCIVCHGSSDALAIRNSVRVAQSVLSHHVNDRIVQRLEQTGNGKNGKD